MEQYPLDLFCSEIAKTGLLNHFMEVEDDSQDEAVIGQGSIQELASLYIGIKEYNGFLIGSYCDEKITSSPKVEIINLFANSNIQLERVESAEIFIDIVEEADYIEFVKRLFSLPDELCVRVSNYVGDIHKLTQHLQIIAHIFLTKTYKTPSF